MKLVALWIALVVVTAAAIGSCSINHRSTDFACERTSDCAMGRVCNDGFCVSLRPPIDAGVEVDAPPPPPPPRDAPPDPVCPEQCTSCETGAMLCTVDCARGGDVCSRPITCPAGWTCDIKCSTRGSCNSGVDCTDARSCAISCAGPQTCGDVTCGSGGCNVDCVGTDSCLDVDCGTGKCDVLCNGTRSCAQVDCSRACACDVDCSLLNSDCFGVTCPLEQCTDLFDGCSSEFAGCNTCQ